MSFLLRRNLPRAWAGFYDTFDDYGSGEPIPLQWPWFHVGDGEVGWFTDAEEMFAAYASRLYRMDAAYRHVCAAADQALTAAWFHHI